MTSDHLGSPRVITNQNGQVTTRKDYLAFGEETVSAQRTTNLKYDASETRKGYTGYEKDTENGLEFAQARYYNSVQGRFTSVDPLTASASIKNPQTFNRYSYVLNSPYKFVDPLGLISSSTGANGASEGSAKCNFECRVKNYIEHGNPLSKADMEKLQYHVANGTALGYTAQNALQGRQNQRQNAAVNHSSNSSAPSSQTSSGNSESQDENRVTRVINDFSAFYRAGALLTLEDGTIVELTQDATKILKLVELVAYFYKRGFIAGRIGVDQNNFDYNNENTYRSAWMRVETLTDDDLTFQARPVGGCLEESEVTVVLNKEELLQRLSNAYDLSYSSGKLDGYFGRNPKLPMAEEWYKK